MPSRNSTVYATVGDVVFVHQDRFIFYSVHLLIYRVDQSAETVAWMNIDGFGIFRSHRTI